MPEVNEDWRRTVQRGFFIGNGQPVLAFDIVVSEEHVSELEVTDNPVETGVVISDHAFLLPKTLELVIAVSDVSLAPDGAFPDDDPFSSIISRSATALAILEGLQASFEPFDVQAGLTFRQNMVLKRIETSTDKDTAGVLIARLSLREVQIVSTRTVTYPPRKTGKPNNQASKRASRGEQQAQQVTDPKKATSVLADQFGVGTPQGKVITQEADLSPDLQKVIGPGSGLPTSGVGAPTP
jgi:hypothetical protein